MRQRFRDLAIRRKLMLVIMLVSGIGLLLAGTAIVAYERFSFQQRMTKDMSMLAEMIGAQNTAALAFDDPKTAKENLAALKAHSSIAAAAIYDPKRKLFADYSRRGEALTLPSQAQDAGHRIIDDHLEMFQPIEQDGEVVGMVYLQSGLQEMRAYQVRSVLIVAAVIAVLMIMTPFLSAGLQRAVADPIVELAQVAHAISDQKDYTVRAAKRGQDETGELIDTFNAMLGQIQVRDTELLALNETLEQRVQNRTEQLSLANEELQGQIAERLRIEGEMLRAQHFLSSVVENIPHMVFVKDASELRFVSLNKAGEELLGQPREQLIGKSDYDFFSTEEADFFTAKDREVLTKGKLLDIPEEALLTEQGTRLLHTKKIPIFDANGQPQYLLGISEDITEQHRTEEALRESEERVRLAAETAGVAVWEWDIQSGALTWDEQMFAIYGLPAPPDGRGSYENWQARVFPADLAEQEAQLQRTVATGGSSQREFRIMRASDSEVRVIQAAETAVAGNDGRTMRVVGVNIDITERKQAEDAVRESQRALEFTLEAAQIGYWELDLVTHAAKRSLLHDQTFGYAELQENWTYEKFLTHVHSEDRERVDRLFQVGVETKTQWDFECRITRQDDVERWIWAHGNVFTSEEGNAVRMLGMVRDITERKQAEDDLARSYAELQRAKEDAEAASRAKSEFLANMSHELRTPLNAIIGFSEILEDKTFGDLNLRQSKYVSNILNSGRHLLQLINDILDLVKIEAGRLEVEHLLFEVPRALQDVENIVKTLANKKNVKLEVEVPEDLPLLSADQAKFKQIMYNLFSNAIKFTPEGGSVKASASVVQFPDNAPESERFMRVAVSDTGIGIKEEDQERIFGEFEQVDSSYARQQQGTGLGLSLTKRLVELHSGHIWVESNGEEGSGSTFTFLLPLEPDAELQNGAGVTEINTDSAESATPPETVAMLPQLTVLVVEDNRPASELLTHYLVEAGYRVEHAADGEQALQMVHDLQPDVVTLDIMLPKKDGWEVLAELKSTPTEQNVPVIIVSMTEDRQLGFSLGALDFLVKPVNKERFIEAVRKATAQSGKASGTVLIVDDEPKTVELLTDLLRHEGYDVLQAYGGQQGIDLAFSRLPDVIILDLMMPEVTGFEVVQRLRENDAAESIPILIFTAKDITFEDRQRLNSHIRAIVSKSGKEDLLRELEKLRSAKLAEPNSLS